MKFIDQATITVQSGNGGRGCVSFRREKFIPRGGPDGGDGGKGGDVILAATSHRRTLYQFRYKKHFSANNGDPGLSKHKTGKRGADLVIELPVGTLIVNAESKELIRDLVQAGETFLIAQGGRGGRGNARFKSATHRTPRFAQPGEKGQALSIHLELKLLADVGLIGLPNAGKSTLISRISAARPKIADYPFTTLVPNLGVVETPWGESFVVADIPGLIEGAHAGAGLGIQFLRHIERTRILVHLIDAGAIDPDAPLEGYQTVSRELENYSESLTRKDEIVVLNKLDLPLARQCAERFKAVFGDREVLEISAVTGRGIDRLIGHIKQRLDRLDENI